ncbi:hypothetical protein PF010_g15452 [Phytophthora fragariae]|uniref:Uncharacterized protein n=1 Tax=Phytophthora fragariae TaxID=53985 RepID=A0A6A3F682_9STRA|nr:hypothetical protein PF003_g10914 [Phytophthora fragariae]KAE8939230.1 hypothetical protein PF009_g10927 [Phytophthora fragariae]KAE9098730.1 hypothetical protein PF010_g15452 [Phytophthora fragariae]KAE9105773.1 hypothetical protein PF006_g21529 [Phytophthora fragariae]KAE9124875.1 hypothetical protein PF007_g6556 [Phytophthora fragariae]
MFAVADQKAQSPEKLEFFFQSAMERFLKEQQAPQARLKPSLNEDQDVEMESVESPSTILTTLISVNRLVQRLQRRRRERRLEHRPGPCVFAYRPCRS